MFAQMSAKILKTAVVLSLFSASAFAGGEMGNGGAAVVCRNSQGKVRNVELLDLFEARALFNLGEPSGSTESVSGDIDLALEQVWPFRSEVRSAVLDARLAVEFIPSGTKLLPVNDAFPILGKVDCEIEQLANYGNDGVLRVDQALYERLTPRGQAALFLHEGIYSLARKHKNAHDSVKTRKLVGLLFSGWAQDLAHVDAVKAATYDALGARLADFTSLVGKRFHSDKPFGEVCADLVVKEVNAETGQFILTPKLRSDRPFHGAKCEMMADKTIGGSCVEELGKVSCANFVEILSKSEIRYLGDRFLAN